MYLIFMVKVGAAAAKWNKAIGELVAMAIEQVGTDGHFSPLCELLQFFPILYY